MGCEQAVLIYQQRPAGEKTHQKLCNERVGLLMQFLSYSSAACVRNTCKDELEENALKVLDEICTISFAACLTQQRGKSSPRGFCQRCRCQPSADRLFITSVRSEVGQMCLCKKILVGEVARCWVQKYQQARDSVKLTNKTEHKE